MWKRKIMQSGQSVHLGSQQVEEVRNGDMITAAFNDGEGYKRVPGLWQWDRGQTLKICGLDFQNKTMEVHFAIAGSETAKTVIGEVKENHILAKNTGYSTEKREKYLGVFVFGRHKIRSDYPTD